MAGAATRDDVALVDRVSPAHGDWIDLLRANGFEIERLIELRAAETAGAHEYYDHVSPEWARQWPAEEIWVARLAG